MIIVICFKTIEKYKNPAQFIWNNSMIIYIYISNILFIRYCLTLWLFIDFFDQQFLKYSINFDINVSLASTWYKNWRSVYLHFYFAHQIFLLANYPHPRNSQNSKVKIELMISKLLVGTKLTNRFCYKTLKYYTIFVQIIMVDDKMLRILSQESKSVSSISKYC